MLGCIAGGGSNTLRACVPRAPSLGHWRTRTTDRSKSACAHENAYKIFSIVEDVFGCAYTTLRIRNAAYLRVGVCALTTLTVRAK